MRIKTPIIPNATYTRQEARELLGVGEITMWKIVRDKKLIPSVYGKRKYIFLGTDLLDF